HAPTVIYTLSLHDALPICRPANEGVGWRRAPVTDRAPLVVPPAAHGAIAKERARVPPSSGDGDRIGDAADGHRRRISRGDGCWSIKSPVAELALVVLPPALHRTVGKQRARVEAPRRHRTGCRD